MRKQTPPPSPCTVTRFGDNGEVVATYTTTREPIRFAEREPEQVRMRLRVMCLQETGEEQFVGYATDHGHAHALEVAWRNDHPEHHSFWTERV